MILSTFADLKSARLPVKVMQVLEELLPMLNTLSENGEYPLSNNAKAIVSAGITHPLEKVPYESHTRMTDIHIVLEGEEYLYVRPVSELTKMNDPSEIKAMREDLPLDVQDLQFYKEQGNEHARLHLTPHNFCIIFPNEAHAVGIMVNKAEIRKKLVVKIPL